MSTLHAAKLAKEGTYTLASLSEGQRVLALQQLSAAILKNVDQILKENQKDLLEAKSKNLSEALIDRLKLSKSQLENMAKSCLDIAQQTPVLGLMSPSQTRPNGLVVKRQRIPIGCIGMIFESRPNVVIDGIALAIKSGNALILKGGSEAHHSNRVLFDIAKNAVSTILPAHVFQLLESREEIAELLKLNEYIDLMIARGGSSLVTFVKKNATMPVIAHDKGLCHLYVHHDADVDTAVAIIINAKVSRPGVCNALESLLLHEKFPLNLEIIEALLQNGVEIRASQNCLALHPKIKLATEDDFKTEYLDMLISLKLVQSHGQAIEHIQQHSSHHTEAILAKDKTVINDFINALDASCLMINTSTRFNDGAELGLGAELGISTSKLHAYGPMGALEMTTTRFIVEGSGQIR